MKNLNYLKVISTIIVLILVVSSCNTTKKMAISCPEPTGRYKSKALNHPKHTKKQFALSRAENRSSYSSSKYISKSSKSQRKTVDVHNASSYQQRMPISKQFENTIAINELEYKTNLYAALDNSNIQIDTESLKTSTPSIIAADFGMDEHIYERLSVTSINTGLISDKNYVTYSLNRPSDLSNTPLVNIQQEGTLTAKQNEGLGIAGMIVSLAGLLILPIPCGIVGVILSAISLSRINKNPNKYKGKGFAIAGLAVGLVVLVLGIAILAAAV